MGLRFEEIPISVVEKRAQISTTQHMASVSGKIEDILVNSGSVVTSTKAPIINVLAIGSMGGSVGGDSHFKIPRFKTLRFRQP